MVKRASILVPSVLSVLLLLGAVVERWPYGYYTLLRLVVCGTALYLLWIAYQAGKPGWAIVLGLTGLLFNPVIPIRMRRADWQLFDIAAAIVIAAAAFWFGRRAELQAGSRRTAALSTSSPSSEQTQLKERESPSGAVAKSSAGLDILLLSNDVRLSNFVRDFLRNHRVTVASSTDQAKSLLRNTRYGLVIVTNFGIGALDAVSAIPERRDYPVLLLTGYLDESLKVLCTSKNIPWRMVPITPGSFQREIRIALDDLSLYR